jgi:hypothetical protein
MTTEHKSVLSIYHLPTVTKDLGKEEAWSMVVDKIDGVSYCNNLYFAVDEHELLEYIEEGVNEDLIEALNKEYDNGANYIFAREVNGPSCTFGACLETFLENQSSK